MRRIFLVLAIAGLSILFVGESRNANANTKPQLLTGILNKMEKAHQDLKSLKAEMVQQKTNSQIGITDTELGQLIYKPGEGKAKGKLRVDYTKPSKDIMTLIGESVTFYQPRTNTVYKSTLAKASKGKVGGYSQLAGLDSSLKSLLSNYNIDLVKDESIDGKMATVLRLTPKTSTQFSTIDVWVSQDNSLPIQWKIFERNGDYSVVTLKNMQINTNIPDTAFNVSIPSGTKVVDKI